jgi:hypothetical protein
MDHTLEPSPTSNLTPDPKLGSTSGATLASTSRRRRERYGLLLAAIVAAFWLQGIATPGAWEQVFVSVLLATTLVLAMWVADSKPAVMWAAFGVAAAVVIASIAESAAGNIEGAAPRIANLLLVVLAPPAIVVGVVRSVRARGGVVIEAVLGVLCLYILVGMGFALAYGAISDLTGHFFANGIPASGARCLYFSFATLTTVGYGDLTAASNLGHTLSTSEALVGQIYLVTIVSLLVSNLRPRSRDR